MRWCALYGLLLSVVLCWGKNAGTLDGTRLINPEYNFATGRDVSMFRAAWQARGGVWMSAVQVTPEYLAGMDVFVTGLISTTGFSPAELDALVAWVKAGGTLIVTGDCS